MHGAVAREHAIDELSLGDIVARLWRGKRIIILVTVLFTTFFGVIAFTAQPLFRTMVSMMPAENDRADSAGAMFGSLGNVASMIGIDLGSGNSVRTQEALAVLRSREFREAFIADLDLMPQLFASRWDADRRQWKSGLRRAPDLTDALQKLEEIVVIGRNLNTGMYTVQVEWIDPRQAATWANALVARLNSEMRARAIRRSSGFIETLEKELATTDTVDTRDAIARVIGSHVNERMLATVTDEFAFRVVAPAPVPDRKFWPRKGLQLMVGAIAGGFVSSVLVLFGPALRRNLDDALRA